jgi:hypothetical protein
MTSGEVCRKIFTHSGFRYKTLRRPSENKKYLFEEILIDNYAKLPNKAFAYAGNKVSLGLISM